MKHTLRLIAGSTLLLMLLGCHAPASSNSATSMELKIYSVPPDQTQNLAQSLGLALGIKANVTTPAPGKLLVYAPLATQTSIGAAIASLGKASPSEQVPAQVEIHFWSVAGITGAGTDDPALHNLEASLASLHQAIGPLHFKLEQRVSAVVASQHGGSIETSNNPMNPDVFQFQVGAVDKDTADISLTYGITAISTFKTHILARLGQYIVLAQMAGACPLKTTGQTIDTCPVSSGTRLLIIRVDRLKPNA
jgi:hypothetical protein